MEEGALIIVCSFWPTWKIVCATTLHSSLDFINLKAKADSHEFFLSYQMVRAKLSYISYVKSKKKIKKQREQMSR